LVKSMTGYGSGEASNEQHHFLVEVRSVNNRYLEVAVRLPRQLQFCEEMIKKLVSGQISRGRVDIFVTMRQASAAPALRVDESLALAYQKELQHLCDLCSLPGEQITLELIAGATGVFTLEAAEADNDKLKNLLVEAITAAMEQLVAMRTLEGSKLAADLLDRINLIATSVEAINERAPLALDEQRVRLKQRLEELLSGATPLDESRLAQEVAIMADKTSITEELVRLHSHLKQLADTLQSNQVVGRKLDFLIQELNREVNTIGSKTNDLTISNIVIDVKAELEKIREQVQNIE